MLYLLGYAIAGAVVGALATLASDAASIWPGAPLAVGVAILCVIAVQLRRLEYLAFFARAGCYSYALFLGLAIVRYANAERFIYHWLNGDTHAPPVRGLELILPVVALAFAGVFAAIASVAWGLAQRLNRPQRDSRADDFLAFLNEKRP